MIWVLRAMISVDGTDGNGPGLPERRARVFQGSTTRLKHHNRSVALNSPAVPAGGRGWGTGRENSHSNKAKKLAMMIMSKAGDDR